MNLLQILKYYLLYPYHWYKRRKRLEKLRKQDPFIYK